MLILSSFLPLCCFFLQIVLFSLAPPINMMLCLPGLMHLCQSSCIYFCYSVCSHHPAYLCVSAVWPSLVPNFLESLRNTFPTVHHLRGQQGATKNHLHNNLFLPSTNAPISKFSILVITLHSSHHPGSTPRC